MIGGRIGDMGGFSYMEFIVPGLIMMSPLQARTPMFHLLFLTKIPENIERNSRGAQFQLM